MSYFSRALTRVLEARGKRTGMSQGGFADSIKMARSVLNRYAGGKFKPDSKSLETILKSLSDDERTELLLALIHDAIPEQYKNLVKWDSGGNPKMKSLEAEDIKLPDNLEAAFRFLRRAVIHNEDLEKSLILTARMLGFDPLNEVEKKIIATSYRKLEKEKRAEEDPDPRQRKTGSREGFPYDEDPAKAARLNEEPPPPKKK